MRVADGQLHLPGVLGSARNSGQQQWPAGNRLAIVVRVSQANEQAPPIVNQRNHSGEQPATLQVASRKTAPTPLVLQFVEGVFDIPFVMPLII
jgi:hypothetical protein